MLKAKIWLLDSIGRALSDSEKQYLDLTANPYENFAGNTPIYLKEDTARQFKACATEICFSDGSVWEGGENGWEEIPAQKAITEKMRSAEALMEFKAVYCKDAQYLPVTYKDLWFCACGGANKSERKTCWRCHADFQAMEEADEFTLKNNHLYKKGVGLVGAKTSQEIAKGIEILSGIEDWKDSKNKLEEAKARWERVSTAETTETAKKNKRNKKIAKISVISLSTVAVLGVTMGVVSAIVKNNRYEQAQTDYENGKYEQALEGFEGLGNYKDAKRKALRAVYMLEGDYGKIVKMDNLTEFTIPDGVTSISNYTFDNCDSLTNVVIGDSVTSIGEGAFSNCVNLTSVVIGDSVTSIGDFVFSCCHSLTTVTLGNSVTCISDSAFDYCESLIYNEYGNCKYLGNQNNQRLALITTKNKNLSTYTIAETTKVIADSAFSECSKLTSVAIPDSVTSIGEGAFSDCSSLTSVMLGNGVTRISASAFSKCDSLIYNEYENCKYLGNENNPSLALIRITDGKFSTYTIAETTKVIADSAFRECIKLTSLVIPDSVTSIGTEVFAFCSSLVNISVDENNANYKSINGDLYNKDGTTLIQYAIGKSTTSFTIPDGVTSIGDSAFYYCRSLTSVMLGNGVTRI
ncbi:MAG: leucine-rich repeat domain-containing protein, partial [Clostridia bacterium]|nr:leucine-rich repeat domain-containing protein [Clostridia bacterium]